MTESRTTSLYWWATMTPEQHRAEAQQVLAAIGDREIDSHDWWDLLEHLGQDDRMLIMAELADVLTPQNLGSMLTGWWATGAQAWRHGERNVVRWFRRAGPLDAGGFGWPTAPVTGYRGTLDDLPRARRGLSWSLDPEKPDWFTRKDPVEHWPTGGWIWETEILPGAVLATFDDIGERELVVDPSMLGEIRLREERPLNEYGRYQLEQIRDFRETREREIGHLRIPVEQED